MDFLKRLFGGGGSQSSSDPDGLYFYVRPKGCEEVVRVRINRMNDISLADDGETFWVHKSVRGIKCRQTAELDIYFDRNRKLANSEIKDGDLVDARAYEEWMAGQDQAAQS
ncbi:MAG: hypothetical protein IT320_14365 [Anaerolineae bacterium]|nr:hypothetical protein [Anaerolineae bacterium]